MGVDDFLLAEVVDGDVGRVGIGGVAGSGDECEGVVAYLGVGVCEALLVVDGGAVTEIPSVFGVGCIRGIGAKCASVDVVVEVGVGSLLYAYFPCLSIEAYIVCCYEFDVVCACLCEGIGKVGGVGY